MKTFVIINGKELAIVQRETKADAIILAENVCDHSKEIIVREIEKVETFKNTIR